MFGCSKYKRSNELDGIPMLSGITYETSSFDSVRISANIIQENGVYPITKRGFCWSTSSSTPTINDFNCDLGTGFGKLEYWITGLSSNQQIFVRVYATNQAGTKYSDVQEIKSIPTSGYGPNIVDIEGNSYQTVYIGTQHWMAENLKNSKYSDGTKIPHVTNKFYLYEGAWAYYNDNDTYNEKYGKLYNWYAVSPTTNGNKNICPTGWHVPTDAEWTVVTDYLGGKSVAGGKMKQVGTTSWDSPNTEATNMSLFTGLPGGYRDRYGYQGHKGIYIGVASYWWSSSEYDKSNAWYRYLTTSSGDAFSSKSDKDYGFSVRCLRD